MATTCSVMARTILFTVFSSTYNVVQSHIIVPADGHILVCDVTRGIRRGKASL
jgi:hypothetical protein